MLPIFEQINRDKYHAKGEHKRYYSGPRKYSFALERVSSGAIR